MINDLERNGLTLAEIARRIGVHAPALSMTKAGKRIDMMYSSGKRLEKLHREVCGHANAD